MAIIGASRSLKFYGRKSTHVALFNGPVASRYRGSDIDRGSGGSGFSGSGSGGGGIRCDGGSSIIGGGSGCGSGSGGLLSPQPKLFRWRP